MTGRERSLPIELLAPLALLALLAGSCAGGGRRAPAPALDPTPPAAAATRQETRQAEIERLTAGSRLGLQELAWIAELANPDLAAAREDWRAAGGRTRQAGLYPNPALELEAEDVPAGDPGLGRSKNTIALSQPLILGGRRAAATSAARADEEARGLALEATRREVLGALRALFVEILHLERNAALHVELLEVARRTHAIARERFEARAAPEAEAIRAELEVRELELGERRLAHERGALAERLRALLGGVEVPLERVAGALPAELPEIDRAALGARLRDHHPALAAARARIEAADRRLEEARAARVPDLDLRIAYGRDEAENADIVEAGLRIPLPLFDRNQGRILEARHLAQRARREADALGARLAAELAGAWAAWSIAREEVLVLRDGIVPAAERALAQARAGYEAGHTTLLELLDAQRTLTRARLDLEGSARAAHLAEADLWRLAGPAPETPEQAERP